MVKLPQPKQKKERDSTIALINIVFLMLIFFLIAGTITPPLDDAIDPVLARTEQAAKLESLLSLRSDGKLYFHGVETGIEKFASEFLQQSVNPKEPARLFVDQNSSAARLVVVINGLKASGIQSIRIVTKRNPA